MRVPTTVRRVLMTTDAVGGVWNYALTLTRRLSASGVHVILTVLGPPPSPEQQKDAQSIPGITLLHEGYALEWMDDPWDDVRDCEQWLLSLENSYQPDLIHLNGYAHAAAAWRAPVVVVAHSCVYSWWRQVHRCSPPAKYHEYHRRVSDGLKRAHWVVAPSRWMLKSLAANYPLTTRASVIYNGIEHSECSRGEKEPTVLAAGRLWDRAKNVGFLPELAEQVEWSLEIAGADATPGAPAVSAPAVSALAANSKAPKQAKLLGRLSSTAVKRAMARSAIFAHPALYEPFGLAPLEAAASGCALVLSELESFRELWGDAAFFVDPRQPQLWREALESLWHDSERLHRLQALAQKRARRYSAECMSAQYQELYARLVAQHLRFRPCAAALPS